MMKIIITMFAYAALVLLPVQSASACTAFAMIGKDGPVVSFSFDFQFGAGYIYVNKRNCKGSGSCSMPRSQSGGPRNVAALPST
jgi:penicillin V acylase-like amidase (Ntn superfamily)